MKNILLLLGATNDANLDTAIDNIYDVEKNLSEVLFFCNRLGCVHLLEQNI